VCSSLSKKQEINFKLLRNFEEIKCEMESQRYLTFYIFLFKRPNEWNIFQGKTASSYVTWEWNIEG